jgi:hypothetical protein
MAGTNMVMTGTPYLADPHAPFRYSCPAATALSAGDVCYVAVTTGAATKAVSTATTIANVSRYEGICLNAVSAGQPVTLFGLGAKIYISDTVQVIGSFWYVSDTAGLLKDTKQATADTYKPVGKMITAHVLEIVRRGV